MAIYHFNMHDGTSYPDTLGTDCAELQAAKIVAVEKLADMLKENAARFWTGDEWTMSVTDHDGLVLFSLTFVATISPATMSRKPG